MLMQAVTSSGLEDENNDFCSAVAMFQCQKLRFAEWNPFSNHMAFVGVRFNLATFQLD